MHGRNADALVTFYIREWSGQTGLPCKVDARKSRKGNWVSNAWSQYWYIGVILHQRVSRVIRLPCKVLVPQPQHHHCMQRTHLFVATPPHPSPACTVIVIPLLAIRDWWWSGIQPKNLYSRASDKWNGTFVLLLPLPESIISLYCLLGPADDYDLTSMTLVMPPPHVLGPKYERL